MEGGLTILCCNLTELRIEHSKSMLGSRVALGQGWLDETLARMMVQRLFLPYSSSTYHGHIRGDEKDNGRERGKEGVYNGEMRNFGFKVFL